MQVVIANIIRHSPVVSHDVLYGDPLHQRGEGVQDGHAHLANSEGLCFLH